MYNPCLYTGCDIYFEDIGAVSHGDLYRIGNACLFYHNGWRYCEKPDNIDYLLVLGYGPSMEKQSPPYEFIFFPNRCLTMVSQHSIECDKAQGIRV